MANTLVEIRLLAASPTDVEREREEAVRKVVDELNEGVARNRGLVLRMLTWRNVGPDLGRAQEVILDQIGGFDIFVGIMGSRFGSPTGEYNSGTEEEFYRAYNLWLATKRPRVMFYFKQSLQRMPTTEAEIEQMARVVRFRSEIQKLGLPKDYSGYEEFVETFRRHLTEVVLQWEETPSKDGETGEQGVAVVSFWRLWNDAFRQERKAGERPEAWLYRSAERSVKFMTISGRSMYSGDIEEALKAKNRAGLVVKLLLFDWNSPWFAAKMKDERRESPAEIKRARVKACNIAQELLSLRSSPSLDLEIRLYQEYPIWRFMIVDDVRCYLGFYPAGKRGYEGPMFAFDRDQEASLFHPVNQFFDLAWQAAAEGLQPDDPRFELRALPEER